MIQKDKEFIKGILSSDFKHITNPDFTHDTLEKITELEENKINYSNLGDIIFLIPMILYAFLSILLSFITEIISLANYGKINNFMYSVEMISSFLWHPITISILFSFSLLYLVDLYLKKIIS
jgi:hypothetical protein